MAYSYYDAQNRLDSIKIRASLSGGITLLSHQKLLYDAQDRMSRLMDTIFIPALNLPIQALDEFLTYLSPTSDLVAVDSMEVRSYYPSSGQYTTVSRLSYDLYENLILVMHEDCFINGCLPYERDRYVYKQLTVTSSMPTTRPAFTCQSLCKAGEAIQVPSIWQGQSYTLYNLAGQLIQRGQLGATLPMPHQAGVYILRVGTNTQRLYVQP